MSNEVYSIAKRRAVGSSIVKSVLLFMADSASDDGSGVWLSKANIARDLELSKRSVQNAIQTLVEMGIVREVGNRPCKNGFTVEYQVVIGAVLKLPSTRAGDAPVTGAGDSPVHHVHGEGCTTFTGTRAGDSPNPPLEPPLEPSIESLGGGLFGSQPDNVHHLPTAAEKLDGQLDEIWAAFPRRPNMPSKAKVRTRLEATLKKVPFDRLMIAVRAYAGDRDGQDPRYTKALDAWLNGEFWASWLDQADQAGRFTDTGSLDTSTAEGFAALVEERKRLRQSKISYVNEAMSSYHQSSGRAH